MIWLFARTEILGRQLLNLDRDVNSYSARNNLARLKAGWTADERVKAVRV